MNKIISTLALVLVASALTAIAQEPAAPAKPGKVGHEGRGGRNPLVAALDTNRDGVLDAAEIANAPASLKTLDKNGDGQVTRDEVKAARTEAAAQGGKNDGQRQGKRGQ